MPDVGTGSRIGLFTDRWRSFHRWSFLELWDSANQTEQRYSGRSPYWNLGSTGVDEKKYARLIGEIIKADSIHSFVRMCVRCWDVIRWISIKPKLLTWFSSTLPGQIMPVSISLSCRTSVWIPVREICWTKVTWISWTIWRDWIPTRKVLSGEVCVMRFLWIWIILQGTE